MRRKKPFFTFFLLSLMQFFLICRHFKANKFGRTVEKYLFIRGFAKKIKLSQLPKKKKILKIRIIKGATALAKSYGKQMI